MDFLSEAELMKRFSHHNIVQLMGVCTREEPVKCIMEFLLHGENISIFHVCMVWIEKSVTRVTDRHHEACLVMPNSDPE